MPLNPPHYCLSRQMTARLVLPLGIGISLWNACSASHPFVQLTSGPTEETSAPQERACRLHELMPRPCKNKSPEWTDDYVVEPLYNCTCAAMKAR